MAWEMEPSAARRALVLSVYRELLNMTIADPAERERLVMHRILTLDNHEAGSTVPSARMRARLLGPMPEPEVIDAIRQRNAGG